MHLGTINHLLRPGDLHHGCRAKETASSEHRGDAAWASRMFLTPSLPRAHSTLTGTSSLGTTLHQEQSNLGEDREGLQRSLTPEDCHIVMGVLPTPFRLQ